MDNAEIRNLDIRISEGRQRTVLTVISLFEKYQHFFQDYQDQIISTFFFLDEVWFIHIFEQKDVKMLNSNVTFQ